MLIGVVQYRQEGLIINTYDLTKHYGVGYTKDGLEFYFDKEDYELIKMFTWRARIDTRRDKEKYYIETSYTINERKPCGKKKQKRLHLHHLVMGYDGREDKNIPLIDHINRNTYDCQKKNLRISDIRNNNINRAPQKSNTSGVIGVNYNSSNNTWVARISDTDGKRIILCQVRNKEKAVKARLQAELDYYGEYAPQKHLFKEYGIDE